MNNPGFNLSKAFPSGSRGRGDNLRENHKGKSVGQTLNIL